MNRRTTIIGVILAFILIQPVYAQGLFIPEWDMLPDVIEYVSFAAPQCQAANGQPGIWEEPPEPVFPGMTLDIGLYFAWIVEILKVMLRDNICWFFAMLQHLANFLAMLANALIFTLNYIAKIILSLWFHLRSWLFEFSSQVDGLRFFIHQIVVATIEYAKIAWDIFLDIANVVWMTILSIINMIVWVGVFITEIINAILQVLGSGYAVFDTTGTGIGGTMAATSTTCSENSNTSLLSVSHPLFFYVRGMIDGYRDSAVGWTFWVLVALAYIKAVIIFSRYLPTGKQGAGNE